MHGTVAVTDFGWYDFLRQRPLEEVNFWTPSDRKRFQAPELSPFLFKLKAPHRAIAGFGYFARWSSLPDWLAWDCFGVGNGCASRREFDLRLAQIRERIRYVPTGPVPSIGCILVVQPTFFPRDQWVAQPSDWHDRTVSSAGYDLARGEGARIWAECRERAGMLDDWARLTLPLVASPAAPRYGEPQVVVPRLGQGSFRVAVTDAYGRACAVTGEHSLPTLDAAHIRAYQADGPHDVRNGLLLRADLHRLFDTGYLTVTEDRRVEVSPRLRADYHNGRTYYPLHGRELRQPLSTRDEPDPAYLRWHQEHIYLGHAG
jgi:putative restriction endonuclease